MCKPGGMRRSRVRSRLLAPVLVVALGSALMACGTTTEDLGLDVSDITVSVDDSAVDTTVVDTTEPEDSDPPETDVPETTQANVPDSDPDEPDEPEGDICVPLKVISEYDVQTSTLINQGAPWEEIQAVFVDETPAVLEAYGDAIELADDDLAAGLQRLLDFTAPSGALAAESTSLEEFGGKLAALPNLQEAGEAGLALNTFAEAECGFATGQGGG